MKLFIRIFFFFGGGGCIFESRFDRRAPNNEIRKIKDVQGAQSIDQKRIGFQIKHRLCLRVCGHPLFISKHTVCVYKTAALCFFQRNDGCILSRFYVSVITRARTRKHGHEFVNFAISFQNEKWMKIKCNCIWFCYFFFFFFQRKRKTSHSTTKNRQTFFFTNRTYNRGVRTGSVNSSSLL